MKIKTNGKLRKKKVLINIRESDFNLVAIKRIEFDC